MHAARTAPVLILLALCWFAPAAAFDLSEYPTVGPNNGFSLYDFSLPAMISAVELDGVDSDHEKLWRAVSFVVFHSHHGMFERHPGLGTGTPWRFHCSVMMRTGNLFCSEQSMLAAMLLEPHTEGLALRDVDRHTFHEVLLDGAWRIVDPDFDMRIRNRGGEAATFADVQAWLAGDAEALQLPDPLLPRTVEYLDRYRQEHYKRIRHDFGDHLPMQRLDFDYGLHVPPGRAVPSMKAEGALDAEGLSLAYHLYVRNAVYAAVSAAPDPREAAWAIQDQFFARIRKEAEEKVFVSPYTDRRYLARNYQLLGRHDKALELFATMAEDDEIAYHMAESYYLQGDTARFNSLAERLRDNQYYRYLYRGINREFLLPDDATRFATLPTRHFRYPERLSEK